MALMGFHMKAEHCLLKERKDFQKLKDSLKLLTCGEDCLRIKG